MGSLALLSQHPELPQTRLRAAAQHLGPFAALASSIVMVVFLGAASPRVSAPPTQDHQDRQPLSARRLDAGQIELVWNARDSKLASADEAILTIVDGGNERSEYLSADAIHRGSYRYQRQSWDVWFCLRLFHNGHRLFMEDVRLFDSAPEAAEFSFDPPAPGQSYIQVAAVPKSDAEGLGRALSAQHLPVALDPVLGGTNWYRVLVGPIHGDSELPGRLAEIRQTGLVEGEPFARKF